MRNSYLVIIALVLALTVNCMPFFATQIGVPSGAIYTSGETGITGSYADSKYRTGEACASSILGWFATGDASIAAATGKVGITKVVSVTHKATGALGYWQSYCVVVRGY